MRLTGKGRIKALYDEAKLFLGEARWLPMCDFGVVTQFEIAQS